MTTETWRVEAPEEKGMRLIAGGVTREVAASIASFRSDVRPLFLVSASGEREAFPPREENEPGWKVAEIVQPDGMMVSPLHKGTLSEDAARKLAAALPNPGSIVLIDPEGSQSFFLKTADRVYADQWN
jgi:hypothetical protein